MSSKRRRNRRKKPDRPVAEWGVLPLLPLRCVVEHLNLEDALNAMSACRHWRATMLLYEGHRETLKLRTSELEKNLFLARLFRKHVKKLHVLLDGAEDEDMDNFTDYVLPQFLDISKLDEVIFLGPTYFEENNDKVPKLKSITTERLALAQPSLRTLALLGAGLEYDYDLYTSAQIEYYRRPDSYNEITSTEDSPLNICINSFIMSPKLQHIMLDYDQLSTSTLQALSNLPALTTLTVGIGERSDLCLTELDWRAYSGDIDVTVLAVGLKYSRLQELIDNVLVAGMPLRSLKMIYCDVLHAPLVSHVVSYHARTLKELVWADAPRPEPSKTRPPLLGDTVPRRRGRCDTNPLILLCWQCRQLERLVIHGHWVWQYDIVGFIRLCPSLRCLSVSAVAGGQANRAVRVTRRDVEPRPPAEGDMEAAECRALGWAPTPWRRLPPALRSGAEAYHRADYVLKEATADTHGLYSEQTSGYSDELKRGQ